MLICSVHFMSLSFVAVLMSIFAYHPVCQVLFFRLIFQDILGILYSDDENSTLVLVGSCMNNSLSIGWEAISDVL